MITFFKFILNFIILKLWTTWSIQNINHNYFLKFLLNFIIVKLPTVLEASKREIIINFVKFLLNLKTLKHLNYPWRIENRNPKYLISKREIIINVFKFLLNFIILKLSNVLEESKTEIIINFFKFLLNFTILKLSTLLEVSKREIIINFFKFLLNLIIWNHLNYPLRIQNRNNNYFFKKNILNFIILKLWTTWSIQNRNHNYFFKISFKVYNFKTFNSA